MSVRVGDPLPSSASGERDLLALLGLGSGASNDQVEAAHDEILAYLDRSPSSLRAWARAQATAVDEAYARLNGAPASASSKPAPVALARAVVQPSAARIDRDDLDGFYDRDDDQPRITVRRERRAARAQAERQVKVRRSEPGTLTLNRSTLKRGAIGGGLVVAAILVAFGVYQFGNSSIPGINGSPAPAASGLDTAAISADMQKLAANPKDIPTLQDLANLYYAAGDYATAQTWLQKILDQDPRNVAALLGYGATAYNTGDFATAETMWRTAIQADPKNIEAHYDLGFMYFSQTPPNVEGVKTEWAAVLALNPDSDLKTYIEAHLASLTALASGAPSAAPAASTAPGSSSAPAGSAAPTTAPATSPAPSPAAS